MTVGISLVMTSGFMFVRIREMPFTGGDGNWIAAGYSNQYGQETQVVAMICEGFLTPFACPATNFRFLDGLLAASFLMLTLVTPLQSSPGRQRAQVYLWTGVILVVFSILISLFRVKNRGELLWYRFSDQVSNIRLQAIPSSYFCKVSKVK